MKNLISIFIAFSFCGCLAYEWETSPRRVFRPAPVFCYRAYENSRCFPTAETCINDERLHDDVSMTPCRAVYITR